MSKEHPHTLTSINDLAIVLGDQNKYEQAEEMHRQELGLCEKVLDKEHPDTLTSMNDLATVLSDQGKGRAGGRDASTSIRAKREVAG